jgi:hypothetical protein
MFRFPVFVWLQSRQQPSRASPRQRRRANSGLPPRRTVLQIDAQEEAGCADERLLDHCRGPGPMFVGAGRWMPYSRQSSTALDLGVALLHASVGSTCGRKPKSAAR